MRVFLALALIAGVALGNLSSHHYGWTPNKEFTYKFETQNLVGIPAIKSQFAGLKLSSEVKIQTFQDYSLRIKFEDPKFIVVNKELIKGPDGRMEIPPADQDIPSELRGPLTKAFVVHLKRGVVETLIVEKDEPVVVTNIKKALLSQIQLDITGMRKDEVWSNQIQQQQQDEGERRQNSELENISFFNTEETTIIGDCQTSYTLHQLPEYQSREIEQELRDEVRIFRQEGQISSGEIDSRGEEICSGKKYFKITKVKNLDQCKKRPMYQTSMGVKIACDAAKSQCRDVMSQMASTTYLVCGTSLEDFVVRKANTDNRVSLSPLYWNTNEEKISASSRASLVLLKVKTGGFTPLPKPQQPKEKKSLIYEYPAWSQHSSQSQEEVEGRIESNRDEIEPIFPMPDMHSAPRTVLPRYTSISDMTQQILAELEKLVSVSFKSPESCSSRADVSGNVWSVTSSLRYFSLEDLKQLEQQIRSKFSQEQGERRVALDIFGDILSLTGTNPSVALIKERILSNEWEETTSLNIIQNMIRSVKTPTKEVFQTILELAKKLKSQNRRILYNSGLISLSNLVYKACVHPEYKLTHFPVRVYGWFCNKDSSFITEEYIPYLVSELERSEASHAEHLVLISALGKLGHQKTLLPLVKVVEGKLPQRSQEKPRTLTRSLAVYAMKRLAKRDPSLVRPILTTLIDNLAENPEVRIAAIAVLPWTQPSTAVLQKIAVRSWFEPSKQVAAFIHSTLTSLTKTEIPELKNVGRRAFQLVGLMKPFQYGFQYSQNMHNSKFVEYLRTASSVETSYVFNEKSVLPSKVKVDSRLVGGSWEMQGVSFAFYTESMDAMLERAFERLGMKSKASHEVLQKLQEIDRKLNIVPRKIPGGDSQDDVESLVQMRLLDMELMFPFDRKIKTEIIAQLMEELRINSDILFGGKKFTKTHVFVAMSSEIVLPSVSGFPLSISRNMPVVLSVKGEIEANSDDQYNTRIVSKLIPTFNGKMETNVGVIDPFSKQFVGSGVEMSLHLSLPLKSELDLKTNGELSVKLSVPEEVRNDVELLHYFVMPYTVVKRMGQIQPINKASELKKILSGNPEKKMDIPFGRSVGIDVSVKLESDMQHFDFPQLLKLAEQHNVGSFLSAFGLASSVRDTSVKVEFSPSKSTTKEIETTFKIVYGKTDFEGQSYVSYPSESEISPEMERQLENTCRLEHQQREKIERCVEKRLQKLESSRMSHHKVKEMLQKLEKGASVQGVNVDAALLTESGRQHKALKTIVLLGGQKVKINEFKTLLAVIYKSPESGEREVEIETLTVLPQIQYRWNVQSLIDEEIDMKSDVKIKYGKRGEAMEEIVLESKWSKTGEMKESIKRSTEWKKCQEEIGKNRALASVCEEVRHQASSVNGIWMKVKLPKSLESNSLVSKIENGIKGYFLTLVRHQEQLQSGERNEYELKTYFSRRGDVAQVEVKSPVQKFELKDVRVPVQFRKLMPLSLRNGVTLRLIQDISRDQNPASCRINPTEISTFDNKTYEYSMNECQHLVFKDCTQPEWARPLSVLAKKIRSGSEEKEIEVLSGKYIVKVKVEGSSVSIKVNGQEVPLSTNEYYVKKSDRADQEPELILYRSRDNVVTLQNPIDGLYVAFDGKRLEVVAPQILRQRTCGLCGDLNGENTADLKTPEKILLSKPRFVGYSYMLKEESGCPGIPSEDRSKYEEERRLKIQKRELITPLEGLVRKVVSKKHSIVRPTHKVHVTEVQRNQICISKKAIKICQDGTKPEKLETKSVAVTCLQKHTAEAQQLLTRAKAGESLESEVQERRTAFTKKILEPVKCVRGGQADQQLEEQEWNYRSPVRRHHSDVCPQIYKPVCSLEGHTFTNECFANKAGAQVLCRHECPCY